MIKEQLIKKEPFEDFGSEYDYVAFFDENGSASSLDYIQDCLAANKPIDDNRRYFTLTCCIFTKNGYAFTSGLIKTLKKTYWKKELTQPIILHTKDIVKKEKCFKFGSERKYKKFIDSLTNVVNLARCKIISVTFDLYSYAVKGYRYDPYEVAFDTIVRVIMHGPYEGKRFALVFEARGKEEDKTLGKHIEKIINHSGTKDFKVDFLQEIFKGVFFNHKVSKDGLNVYPGIEIVDLCSYPIYRFQRYGTRSADFEIVVKKIIGYKDNQGDNQIIKGLRHFPKEWI